MNLDRLYNAEGRCKLCLGHRDEGCLEDCPGLVLTRLRYEVQIYGSNCARGCCGYTDTRVEGDTISSVVEQAAEAGTDCVRPSYTSRMFVDIEDLTPVIQAQRVANDARRIARETKEKAAREAKARAVAKQKAREALELEREYLSMGGYARKLAQVEAMP